MDMSQAIKQARTDMEMTRKELASQLGCTEMSIYNWETGNSRPLPVYLVQLEKVLGIDLKEAKDVHSKERPSPEN